MYIAFAPLQGYTTATYRAAHCQYAGGVDEYYTPFVRIEKGVVRPKDLRDTDPTYSHGVPTVPQVIARDADEFATLCDALQCQGWQRIDLNLGCPFPMQVRAGRGCGLLQHLDRLEAIARVMQQRTGVVFSAKMRLGQDTEAEGLRAMPIVNDMPLLHVALHPRLGRQQYKGVANRVAFAQFASLCTHPVVYNGDIANPTVELEPLATQVPNLKGAMVGRALLARPWLLSANQPQVVLSQMHSHIYTHATATLCGDSQILAHLQAFWYYIDIPHRQKKAIMKATTLPRYREAVAAVL